MVNVNAQINAVERGLETKDVDGVRSYVQTLSQTYPSPIDDVWDAMTSTERIPRWFLPITGDLRLGGTAPSAHTVTVCCMDRSSYRSKICGPRFQ